MLESAVAPAMVRPPDGTTSRARTATILSVASELPEGRLTSAELATQLGISEDWILSRTGIRERRRAAPDERLIATTRPRPGASALDRAGVQAGDLDLVIVATMTQDELTPNTAPLVAHALGADRAGAFDVGRGVHGLPDRARARCGPDRERPRRARAARSAPTSSPGSPTTTTSGRRRCSPTPPARSSLAAERRGGRQRRADRARRRRLARRDDHRHPRRAQDPDGRARGVPPRGRADEPRSRSRRVARAGLTLAEIDLFVYHQANARITRALGERLGLRAERVVDCIETLGNASAATLPVALARRRAGRAAAARARGC